GDVRHRIIEELSLLSWDDLLARRPGWTWDAAAGGLRCPDGQALHLMTIGLRQRANGNAAAYFSTRRGACRDCPLRAERRTSGRKQHKQTNVTLPADVGERLHQLLRTLPRGQPRRARMGTSPAVHRSSSSRPPSPARGGHVLHSAVESTPGPLAVVHPRFLPAAA